MLDNLSFIVYGPIIWKIVKNYILTTLCSCKQIVMCNRNYYTKVIILQYINTFENNRYRQLKSMNLIFLPVVKTQLGSEEFLQYFFKNFFYDPEEVFSRYISIQSKLTCNSKCLWMKNIRSCQGRSLLCYSTEAGGLGAAGSPQWGIGAKHRWWVWGAKPPISDFFLQFRVYLGPVLLQNSHKNMSPLYTIVHS